MGQQAQYEDVLGAIMYGGDQPEGVAANVEHSDGVAAGDSNGIGMREYTSDVSEMLPARMSDKHQPFFDGRLRRWMFRCQPAKV